MMQEGHYVVSRNGNTALVYRSDMWRFPGVRHVNRQLFGNARFFGDHGWGIIDERWILATVAVFGDNRRFQRQSPNSATRVASVDSALGDCHQKRRLSPKSATVVEFDDSRRCRWIRRLSPKTATVAETVAEFGDCSLQCWDGWRLGILVGSGIWDF